MTDNDIEQISTLIDKLAGVVRSYGIEAYHIELLTYDHDGTIDQFLAKGKVHGAPDRFAEMRAEGQRMINERGYGKPQSIKVIRRCQSDH